jgi:hypothetical protein
MGAGCCLDDLPQLFLREVPLLRAVGFSKIKLPGHPHPPTQHQLNDAHDVQDRLTTQTVRLDQRAIGLTPLECSALEIRHEFLNPRFVDRFHGQLADSG